MATLAPAAHAAGPVVQIVVGGSDTIQNVSDPLIADAMSQYNTANSTSDVATNLHAAVGAGQPDLTYTVPATAGSCPQQEKYTTSSSPPAGFFQAPNGSGAGISAMVNAEGGQLPDQRGRHRVHLDRPILTGPQGRRHRR